MTIVVDLGRKATKQTKTKISVRENACVQLDAASIAPYALTLIFWKTNTTYSINSLSYAKFLHAFLSSAGFFSK